MWFLVTHLKQGLLKHPFELKQAQSRSTQSAKWKNHAEKFDGKIFTGKVQAAPNILQNIGQ